MLRYCVFILLLESFVNLSSGSNSEKPFRMHKLNLVWEKASKKLPKEKQKSLYTDLKYQDKEEISWKKIKAEGLDKDGLKEALIRKSFNAILEKYDLKSDFDDLRKEFSPKAVEEWDVPPEAHAKAVFKDKKLNKLWLKAEQQGFSEEQLKTLKEEFQHHQEKIDQYYALMERVSQGSWSRDDLKNTISVVLDEEEQKPKNSKSDKSPHQLLKEKHAELKAGYDYLNTQVVPGIKNTEFDEPQVNSLWEMAKNGSFSDVELDSLRGELHHFEHRIKKLKFLTEREFEEESNIVEGEMEKRKKRLKEYTYKVDKVHKELAERIMSRHTEL